MTAALDVRAALGGYLDRLVPALEERTDLVGVYLLGSAARGGYCGRSDRSRARDELEAVR